MFQPKFWTLCQFLPPVKDSITIFIFILVRVADIEASIVEIRVVVVFIIIIIFIFLITRTRFLNLIPVVASRRLLQVLGRVVFQPPGVDLLLGSLHSLHHFIPEPRNKMPYYQNLHIIISTIEDSNISFENQTCASLRCLTTKDTFPSQLDHLARRSGRSCLVPLS